MVVRVLLAVGVCCFCLCTGVASRSAAQAADDERPLRLEIGDLTITPFVQVRLRPEVRARPYGNGVRAGASNHFVTTRARLALEAQWRAVSVLVQVQDVRNFGTAPGADDGGTFALHQGFLQVGDDRGYIRAGRQEINYGNQRMIGALDWLMSARSFDGLRGHLFFGDWELDLFGAMLAPRSTFTDEAGDNQVSNGSYLGTVNLIANVSEGFHMELYTLFRHDGSNEANPTRKRNIASPGIYLAGAPSQYFKYNVEGIAQFGKANGSKHRAFAGAGDVSFIAARAGSKPSVTLGAAYATGASSDGDIDEFDNFFPTNHKFYGISDLFGLRNIIDAHASLTLSAKRPVVVKFEVFNFALADPGARWSNAGGATLGVDPAGGDRNLGQEVDFVVTWKPIKYFFMQAGYGVFIPNSGAERLGHDEATHFVYVWTGAKTH